MLSINRGVTIGFIVVYNWLTNCLYISNQLVFIYNDMLYRFAFPVVTNLPANW